MRATPRVNRIVEKEMAAEHDTEALAFRCVRFIHEMLILMATHKDLLLYDKDDTAFTTLVTNVFVAGICRPIAGRQRC